MEGKALTPESKFENLAVYELVYSKYKYSFFFTSNKIHFLLNKRNFY